LSGSNARVPLAFSGRVRVAIGPAVGKHKLS
jgi:hypothetical protein